MGRGQKMHKTKTLRKIVYMRLSYIQIGKTMIYLLLKTRGNGSQVHKTSSDLVALMILLV